MPWLRNRIARVPGGLLHNELFTHRFTCGMSEYRYDHLRAGMFAPPHVCKGAWTSFTDAI
jgi:hypothetical protein